MTHETLNLAAIYADLIKSHNARAIDPVDFNLARREILAAASRAECKAEVEREAELMSHNYYQD